MASGFPLSVPAWYTAPSGRELVHHVGPAADRGEREPAADDLAEDRQVRVEPEADLRAAEAEPEPGDDLVEDEAARRARRSDAARCSRKPGSGRDEAHVGGDRLDEHGGELVTVGVERGVERGDVVVRDDDRVGDRARGDAGRAREPERGDAAARGDEQRVEVAVVAAGELHDLVATGGAAGEADRGHRRLGAARHEPHLLDARDPRR